MKKLNKKTYTLPTGKSLKKIALDDILSRILFVFVFWPYGLKFKISDILLIIWELIWVH